jgi:copper(I)-binding protein
MKEIFMKPTFKFATVMAGLLLTMSVHAEVVVKDAWVRATVPQQKATGAFLQIQSTTDARLISVQTPAAGMADIHEMKMDGNIMKMRALEYLDLPAGKLVELKPGSYHVMLTDLKAQIKSGDIIPVTLIVETKDKKRETVELKLKARSLNSADGKM